MIVVELRPAEPTIDDGLVFARHLDTASDGFFTAMLGRRAPEIIARAFVEPAHDFAHTHVTIAERDGRPVGMASAYSAEAHRRSSDEPLRRAAGRLTTLRMAAVTTVFRRLLGFLEHVPDGDFYLQAVAVGDDHRGNGIGSLLIDDVEAQARAAGCRRVVLDVAENNDDARRLYERRGMTLEATSGRALFIPGSRALRMVKPL